MNPSKFRSAARDAWRQARALRQSGRPPVYLISVPKAGTHLMTSALEAFGYRLGLHQPFASPNPLVDYDADQLSRHIARTYAGEYTVEHLTWSEDAERRLAESSARAVFMYRDPRAVVVSYAHFGAHMNPTHPLFDFFKSMPDINDRVTAALEGVAGARATDGVGRIAWSKLLEKFLPWKTTNEVLAVSFEELVGSAGGGNNDHQAAALNRLAAHLGISGDSNPVRLASEIFNKDSLTFRSGKIGGWRDELATPTINLLEDKLSDTLDAWGYGSGS